VFKVKNPLPLFFKSCFISFYINLSSLTIASLTDTFDIFSKSYFLILQHLVPRMIFLTPFQFRVMTTSVVIRAFRIRLPQSLTLSPPILPK
jgi:hypothetical protein